MPKINRWPFHFIKKTRKEHKCQNCKENIEKGLSAYYKNTFTGKRDYIHIACPKDESKEAYESWRKKLIRKTRHNQHEGENSL